MTEIDAIVRHSAHRQLDNTATPQNRVPMTCSVAAFQKKSLQDCNFQAWYPDQDSESRFYTNSDSHGATLSGINMEQDGETLRKQALGECEHLPHFNELSAVKYGFWPLIVVACRHYRLPLPLHFLSPPM